VQNPLGPYGNAVAAILAIIVVITAIAAHVVPGLTPDQWLDSAALLAIGVVFGTQVVQNGTQTRASAALAIGVGLDSRVSALERGATAQRSSDHPPIPAATAATAAPSVAARQDAGL
jgi:hypothetical protein